jgi:hypothetical protein
MTDERMALVELLQKSGDDFPASPRPLSRRIVCMERAYAIQLAFQQSGTEFHPIGDEVVSAAYDNARIRVTGGRNDPAKLKWRALLRAADAVKWAHGELVKIYV